MLRKPAIPALLLPALLAGCASAPNDYPSLATRDAERMAGRFEPPQPYVPPPPLPATLGQLGALEHAADAAHAAFLAEAPRARTVVQAARGAAAGSEAWARAEVALASLISARSATTVPLADLDRLAVDAAVDGRQTAPIIAVRDAVEAQVAAEDATIAQLKAVLDR